MTDAEREVIEAARALSQRFWTNMEPWIDESKRLHAAVRALDQPYRVGKHLWAVMDRERRCVLWRTPWAPAVFATKGDAVAWARGFLSFRPKIVKVPIPRKP